MSNRLTVPRRLRLAAPAVILPRRLLRYRGRWDGPGAFAGRLLVEGRAGREWLDVQALLDGGWDGQPATAILGVTQLVGFAAGAVRVIVPGSQTWTANGTHDVAEYDRLEVAGWGGGGGGASGSGDGSNGGNSRYQSSTQVGGNGGSRGLSSGTNGAGGGATGGDSNVTGETGGVDGAAHGGDAASGSGTLLGTLTGGGGGTSTSDSGDAPGGGGSRSASAGGNGGGGGLAVKLWNYGDAGAPTPGDSVTVTVGSGGGGDGAGSTSDGARGEVRAQWD